LFRKRFSKISKRVLVLSWILVESIISHGFGAVALVSEAAGGGVGTDAVAEAEAWDVTED
jgi:hypothetical protein